MGKKVWKVKQGAQLACVRGARVCIAHKMYLQKCVSHVCVCVCVCVCVMDLHDKQGRQTASVHGHTDG
jgi:hypothetical protein